jgi:uncharacterized protein (DUF488 family)
VKSHKLYTTGYAGHDPASFLGLLEQHRISTVIDVRRMPLSRKKGFSRTALTEFLEANGLEYQHIRDLGVPQELRIRLRAGDCDLDSYLRGFRSYLGGHRKVLDEVYSLAALTRCCLLCVEKCSEECHRSVVAEEVASRNGKTIEVVHL